MAHSQGFITVIKCRGKILREKDGVIYLPFDENYSIYMKNLRTKKVLVKISIDGDLAASLIIKGNSEVNLKRFVDDNLKKGPRFKFIQKTSENIEKIGDSIEDGIIRLEYRFEKDKPEVREIKEIITQTDYQPWRYRPYVRPYVPSPPPPWPWFPPYWCESTWSSNNIYCCSNSSSKKGDLIGTSNTPLEEREFGDLSLENASSPEDNEGKTVRGKTSKQKFNYGFIGDLEKNSHTITFQLKGFFEDKKIKEPVTTKKKLRCSKCGFLNKSTMNNCGMCGHRLDLAYSLVEKPDPNVEFPASHKVTEGYDPNDIK